MGIVSLVISIILALWIFRDSQKRGDSLDLVLLWTVGTLLCWFAVFPVYALWWRRRQSLPERRSGTGAAEPERGNEPKDATDKVECPRCMSDVPASFTRCPHCGTALHEECPACGALLPPDGTSCSACGADLTK